MKKKDEEWDTMCPVCGSQCEYGEEPLANELEIWYCSNAGCCATIDVPITVTRHSGVTATFTKKKSKR